jgi:hypothetical protein
MINWEYVARTLERLCLRYHIDPQMEELIAACTVPPSIAERVEAVEREVEQNVKAVEATTAALDELRKPPAVADDGLGGVDRIMLRRLSEEIDDDAHGRAEIDRAEQTVRGLSLRRIALALEGIEDCMKDARAARRAG